jgi:hypothetical protein
LFSPGGGMSTFLYSIIIEELASNGYVVVGVEAASESLVPLLGCDNPADLQITALRIRQVVKAFLDTQV